MPEADPYRCKKCGTQYVVPGLARDCERRNCEPLVKILKFMEKEPPC